MFRSEYVAAQRLGQQVRESPPARLDWPEVDRYRVSNPNKETVFLAFLDIQVCRQVALAASTKEELLELISKERGMPAVSDFKWKDESSIRVPGMHRDSGYVIREVRIE